MTHGGPSSGAEEAMPDSKPNVLYLKREQFQRLGDKNKLVFQFRVEKFPLTELGLIVYNAEVGREEEFGDKPVVCHISNIDGKVNLNGKKVIFGDQKLPQEDIEEIREALKVRPTYTVIAFYPEMEGNHLTYIIDILPEVSDIESLPSDKAIISARLNPSPPASTRFTTPR